MPVRFAPRRSTSKKRILDLMNTRNQAKTVTKGMGVEPLNVNGRNQAWSVLQAVAMVISLLIFTGCASWRLPPTLGERSRDISYGYTPLDPLPVVLTDSSSQPSSEQILKALPDETMRLAIGEVKVDSSVTYGPAKAGYKGNDYVIVLDYIKYATQPFRLKREEKVDERGKTNITHRVVGNAEAKETDEIIETIPVYVGVGLRLTANVRVNEGSIDLGNLIAIGVAAEAKKIVGTLMIQSLGISGQDISSAIPIPSEINATTIQNALMAIGTIKSKIYDASTMIAPRVVAVYNNVGGGSETINRVISDILGNSVTLDLKEKRTGRAR